MLVDDTQQMTSEAAEIVEDLQDEEDVGEANADFDDTVVVDQVKVL